MDMSTVTKYLERSLQNCSLSNQRRSFEEDHVAISDRTLELNSHISIPSHLEQRLDLETGEIYYINRNNGMRVKEDPRNSVSNNNEDDEFSINESVVTMFSEEDNSLHYYESEESSSESSRENHIEEEEEEQVLVVAGCKACYMYFMVPKLLKDCPKCAAKLLCFDRPHSASP